MKKDIYVPKVEGVGIAIVRDESLEEVEFSSYVVNFNAHDIKNVMVSTKGYGVVDDKKIKTTTFSHFRELVPAESGVLLEPIANEVLGINNEFFVTYYVDGVIHDKKYVFLPEVVKEENFIDIKILDKTGVLIR